MSQEQEHSPDEDKEQKQSSKIQDEEKFEDRFPVEDRFPSKNSEKETLEPSIESEEDIKDMEDMEDNEDDESELKEDIDEEIEESTEPLQVELDDFSPPPLEEPKEFILPDGIKAETFKKTIQNIQNVRHKISTERKKISGLALDNHRKLNEAVVEDIKKDLQNMSSEIGSTINNEKEKINTEFDTLAQKIIQSNELKITHVDEMKENLTADITQVLSEMNKTITTNIEKLINNNATLIGNKRSEILSAKMDAENHITEEINGYRDESEGAISKFAAVSNEALMKITNTSAETFNQLKNELLSTLNSFKSNSDTILTSFLDQNLDAFGRNRTKILENIEAVRVERNSSLTRINERANSASQNLLKKMEIKTQTFKNKLLTDITDLNTKIEDLNKESTEHFGTIVEKTNSKIENATQDFNRNITDGLGSVNNTVMESLTAAESSINSSVNENNKIIETIRSESLEKLTSLKTETSIATKQFQEEMKNTLSNRLDTLKKEMLVSIDNFGNQSIDRSVGASQKLEEIISLSFDDAKSRLNDTTRDVTAMTEKNKNDIKANILSIEAKSIETSNSTGNLFSTELVSTKNLWNEKSSQTLNDVKNTAIAVKSNIEKEATSYIESTNLNSHEIMAAFNEQIEASIKLTDNIFEKTSIASNKSFDSAGTILQKNTKSAIANTASAVEGSLNQANRRFDSAKNTVDGSVNMISTILETQTSNLQKKMRDSASQNQDTLIEYLSGIINQLTGTIENLNRELDMSLHNLDKQCETNSIKSEKKIDQVSDKARNQVKETSEAFIREFNLHKSVTINRIVTALSDIPTVINRLQTKWTTQQEGEIIQTYAKIKEEFQKLSTTWDKFEEDANREIILFIPKNK
ncbi:MAG: hypothetical protein ACTSWY_10900 [Promethearchaeota archaeon]